MSRHVVFELPTGKPSKSACAEAIPSYTLAASLSFGVIHDTIKQRLRASLLASASCKTTLDTAAHLAGELTEQGAWSDLDTEADFDPDLINKHLARTKLLAKARHLAPGELEDALRLAFDWWLSQDFRSADWYQDQILVPRLVGEIALLFEDDLSLGARGKVIEVLTRSRWTFWKPESGWTEWSGAALLGVAYNVILRGCLENIPSLCADAFRRAFRNVSWSHDDNHEASLSIGQIGSSRPLVDGMALTQDYARLMSLAHGTAWQAAAENTRAFITYLLDYQQWVLWGGRPASGVPLLSDREAFAVAIAQLSQLGNPPRREELANLGELLIGKGKPLSGHRYFWRSNLAVHRRPNFYSSLRLGSNGDHSKPGAVPFGVVPDGNVFLVRHGREYQETKARWNPRSEPASMPNQINGSYKQTTLHVPEHSRSFGGVSEGEYGMAATELSADGLRGKKAWFFFDDSVACLETELHGSILNKPVLTPVNHCLLNGPIAVGKFGEKPSRILSPEQRHDLTGVNVVEHDGLRYCFLDTPRVVLSFDSGVRSERPQPDGVAPVFALWVDHGLQPRSSSAAYWISPLEDDPAKRSRTDFEPSRLAVLSNTVAMQAIRHNDAGILGVVFWEAGVLMLRGGGRVAANSPCLLLCRENPRGGVTLSISNLRREASAVHVEYGGRCLYFELAGGANSGRTQSRQL